MSYSPKLSFGFTFAKNRSAFISPQSGMCSFCTQDCNGTCELAQAAVLGAQTVYPTTTGNNQIASEKDYPIDFSHFNINGRVFGAQGVKVNAEIVGMGITDSVNIVIGGASGSITIGTGTEITILDATTYSFPVSVLVADSNGNPVTGAIVSLNLWPVRYWAGVWYDEDIDPQKFRYVTYSTGNWVNEDVNENMVLDPGEDKNGDGKLTPPSSTAGSVPITVTTGQNGTAVIHSGDFP